MAKKVSKRYKEQAASIKQTLAGRPYSIGLDLGVGSIGLAIAAYDEKLASPTDLVFATSRIFTPSAGAADRRLQRGQRNTIRHKANRLRFLWKLLAEEGLMLPFSIEKVSDPARLRFSDEIIRSDPYALRLKGLSEELSLFELGYALYHIANHRGSSSVRTFLDDEVSADDQKLAAQEQETEALAEARGLTTFIEVLADFNAEQHIGFRNVDRLKGKNIPIPTRDIITKEIETLLSVQKSFHPTVLTDAYCDRIQSAMLYENIKIVPEPGNCPYYSDEKKLPRCHFLNEERRIWEVINNARIEKPIQRDSYITYTKIPFTDVQRKTLFETARSGETITVPRVKKLFPELKNHNITLQGRERADQKIVGFRFKELEDKSFWNRLNEDQQDAFFAAWTNMPDDAQLKSFLINTLSLSEAEASDALKTIKLVGDYGPLGKTATMLLMKYIEDGMTYIEAEIKAIAIGEFIPAEILPEQDFLPYYGKVLTESTQELAGKYWHSAFAEKRKGRGFKKPNTAKEEETYGKIANPVVHQTLNELRKLINEVISILGYKPVEAIVELTRDLKVGSEERERISKEQSQRERNANRIYDEYCVPHGLKRRFIEHFRLYEDQEFLCPYCLKTINVDDIVASRAEIDHILPFEDTGDNSYANKVLTHVHCNRKKGKRTPYAAFSSLEIWEQIMHYLNETPELKFKRHKFEITDEEYVKYLETRGFASRFISDTGYVARATVEYLRCLFPETKRNTAIRSLSGRETSILRRAWNLQGIPDRLGREHFIKGDRDHAAKRKNRTDHRHHALDAIVALYCSQSLIQTINTKSAQGVQAVEIEESLPIPNHARYPNLSRKDYRDNFRKHIASFLEHHTFISTKTDHALNGPLVKATNYSVLGANPNGDELVFAVKKKVKDINPGDGSYEVVEKVIKSVFADRNAKWHSPVLQARIQNLEDKNDFILQRYKELLQQAESDLVKQNKELEELGRRPVAINKRTISKRALEMTGGVYYLLSNNSRIKTVVIREPTDTTTGFAYDTGSNLCLDLYHDDTGKLCGEITRKVQAMNPNYVPKYRQMGYSLYVRIYQGDVCEVSASNPVRKENKSISERVRYVRVPNAKHSRTYIIINTFTERKSGFQIFYSNLASSQGNQDSSFSLGSIQTLDARKVQLSPAGLTQFVSPLLKDKEV